MAENSKISWCDNTFNPWTGCLKVSPGCQFCYAETLSNRWGKDVWGPGPKRQKTSESNWRKPLQWNKQAKKEGRRIKVFCASMADVFEDNPQLDEWRAELLDLITKTPNLDWQILTKRPENVNRMIERATGFSESSMWFHSAPHVWIGTSVENQEYADSRIPELLRVPARVRFLSMEPLLGPVDLSGRTVGSVWIDQEYADLDPGLGEIVEEEGWPIHWVIIGGESGSKARRFEIRWAEDLIQKCQDAGVSVFMKQLGSNATGDGRRWITIDRKGENPDEWPEELRVREFPEVVKPEAVNV